MKAVVDGGELEYASMKTSMNMHSATCAIRKRISSTHIRNTHNELGKHDFSCA